jgi:hypothetical protein
MKKSFLDVIYTDLPILLFEFSNKSFNYEKLKMDYWINLVQSKL